MTARSELWGAAQSQAADAFAMQTCKMPSAVLMERAALAVVQASMRAFCLRPTHDVVWALVGPGNNGADALAACRIFRGRGFDAHALVVVEGKGEAWMAQRVMAEAAGVHLTTAWPSRALTQAVWVDGLLGTGSTGAPRDNMVDVLARVSNARGVKIAIDIPTGVDPSTGVCPGASFCADLTVTFVRSKVGLHVTPGRACAGKIVVADIGIAAEGSSADVTRVCGEDVVQWLASLPAARHKGERGHVGVWGGGVCTPGAAVLAGRAAAHAGAGLVTLALEHDALRHAVAPHPSLMLGHMPLSAANVLVVGPGLTDLRDGQAVRETYAHDVRPSVWDASGLAFVEPQPPRAGPRVLTPHPKEAAALLSRINGQQVSTREVEAERLACARRLADAFGATVVLKGQGSLIVSRQRCAVASLGSDALATAGTGDVLSGILAALLARGLPPFEAACAAVHAHACAGDDARIRFAFPTAEDVAQAAASVWTRLVRDDGVTELAM